MMRRAQAAMEFLMTYGWAILVVLAAIGALAYFGVLSPDRFLPDKCTIQGGFSCTDYKISSTDDQIRFVVINNLGTDALNVTVTLTTNDCTISSANPVIVGALDNRDEYSVSFNCSNELEGAIDADITVSYRQSGAQEYHTAGGSITGRAES